MWILWQDIRSAIELETSWLVTQKILLNRCGFAKSATDVVLAVSWGRKRKAFEQLLQEEAGEVQTNFNFHWNTKVKNAKQGIYTFGSKRYLSSRATAVCGRRATVNKTRYQKRHDSPVTLQIGVYEVETSHFKRLRVWILYDPVLLRIAGVNIPDGVDSPWLLKNIFDSVGRTGKMEG